MVFVDIHTSKELLGTSITIHNQLGQLLYQTRITKSITDINVQFLKEGIYFLRTEKQARPTKLLITNRATNP